MLKINKAMFKICAFYGFYMASGKVDRQPIEVRGNALDAGSTFVAQVRPTSNSGRLWAKRQKIDDTAFIYTHSTNSFSINLQLFNLDNKILNVN